MNFFQFNHNVLLFITNYMIYLHVLAGFGVKWWNVLPQIFFQPFARLHCHVQRAMNTSKYILLHKINFKLFLTLILIMVCFIWYCVVGCVHNIFSLTVLICLVCIALSTWQCSLSKTLWQYKKFSIWVHCLLVLAVMMQCFRKLKAVLK